MGLRKKLAKEYLCVYTCASSTQWLPETTKDNKEKTAQEMVKYGSSNTRDFFVERRFKLAGQYQFLHEKT